MRWFAALLLLPTLAFAQVVPGKSIVLNGTSQSVHLGDVLNGVRTISMWLKPTQTIGPNNPAVLPILVRDENFEGQFSTGELNLYFGKTGTTDAGHIVFVRGGEQTSQRIKSDGNTWQINQWYHIAAVLHPTLGMRMYINGILQQETDASTEGYYVFGAGLIAPLFMGRWGLNFGYGLTAEIDELRFYTIALDETQLRTSMCAVVNGPFQNMAAYYNFDNASANSIPTLVGTISGVPMGLSSTALINSNAPVGQASANAYGISSATSTQILMNDVSLTVDNLQTTATGVHLYATQSPFLVQNGSHPVFYGVWFTDAAAQYRATLDYTLLARSCDSCASVETRDFQTQPVWAARNAFSQNCAFVFTNESPGNLSYREEYWLKVKRQFDIGLPDTISACDGKSITLTPKQFTGAKYLWEDGSTNRQRVVDTTGYYWVIVTHQGCVDTAGTFIQRHLMPVFSLGPDTTFCAGDTVILSAPLFDSASYIWAGGLGFGRTFRMFFPGTISLVITVGNCSYSDDITLTMIRPFQLNLGPDTTLCLGQNYVLGAPPGQRYLWSTGDITATTTLFNQSQTVWVKVWNECFERTDTVNIVYEDCQCHFYVPNTFSPNGDGDNDLFMPVTGCLYELYELEIYDRWGNRVFATQNQNEGWDGTFNDKPLPMGVYSYQLRHKKFTSLADPIFERGMINLIR
jgi:gliding motility-associated-like protein